MIIAHLNGRMGNQLFQYAAARGLAARHGVEVALDTRALQSTGTRLCQPHFNWRVVAPGKLPPTHGESPLRNLAWRKLGLRPQLREEKRGGPYIPQFETWGPETYLRGFWQSERYFAPIADDIRQELTITPPPSDANRTMAAKIAGPASVSLHVRRGDYVGHSSLGMSLQGYYRRALDLVAGRAAITPTVFVFSDDPDWVRSDLRLQYDMEVVDLNGAAGDFEDLRLMSLCAHNVIANSSFSWWGAWLNRNPDKLVTAPDRWFSTTDRDNPDIVARGWLTVPVEGA